MAYSRDPRDMFMVACHDAPLNRKQQPVTYTDVTLRADLAQDLAAGEEYAYLEVNWLTGKPLASHLLATSRPLANH